MSQVSCWCFPVITMYIISSLKSHVVDDTLRDSAVRSKFAGMELQSVCLGVKDV